MRVSKAVVRNRGSFEPQGFTGPLSGSLPVTTAALIFSVTPITRAHFCFWQAFELSQMSEDLRRDLVKARERARVSEESVDRKIETIEEENFKRSRAQVIFLLFDCEWDRSAT